MVATAFNALRELERLGLERGADLPAQDEPGENWVGIGFRLGSRRFVAPMTDVVELLKYPDLAPVPRTKGWVRGMANIRGTLLPVMDLNGFLGDHGSSLTRLSRVLVIPIENAYTGVLVDEVFGMRHFPKDNLRSTPAAVDDLYTPYVTGQVTDQGETWPIFSLRALVDDPQFLMVAS